MSVRRVDPPGCACTDCATGQSVPLDLATEGQVQRMCDEQLVDATGMSELEFEVWEVGGANVGGTWRTAADLGYVTPDDVRVERRRLLRGSN